MIIPHTQLSPDALRGVIEEYVTRDGTEFSESGDSIQQVRRALDAGELVLVFDPEAESCNIITPDQYSDAPTAEAEEDTHWAPD